MGQVSKVSKKQKHRDFSPKTFILINTSHSLSFFYYCDLQMGKTLQKMLKKWLQKVYFTVQYVYTVKKFDEVVRHPHLVTQDQFSLVSKKDSGIHADNCKKNIEVFRQTFTNVELLRRRLNVSKLTPPWRDVFR